jgi:hypothetical protein
MDKEESKRLHMDWWGKCRTCRFWQGTDAGNGDGSVGNQIRWNPGQCSNPSSDLYGQETWTEGHCNQWDTFDLETAVELLEGNEENL